MAVLDLQGLETRGGHKGGGGGGGGRSGVSKSCNSNYSLILCHL